MPTVSGEQNRCSMLVDSPELKSRSLYKVFLSDVSLIEIFKNVQF